jgi:hypothetical protein
MSKPRPLKTSEKKYQDYLLRDIIWEYDNEPEKFWKHSFTVWLSEFTSFCINADNGSDALDIAADLAEEEGWMGLFIDNPTEKDYEEQPTCGNHCLVLSSENWRIIQND